jgi:hypothetical protein
MTRKRPRDRHRFGTFSGEISNISRDGRSIGINDVTRRYDAQDNQSYVVLHHKSGIAGIGAMLAHRTGARRRANCWNPAGTTGLSVEVIRSDVRTMLIGETGLTMSWRFRDVMPSRARSSFSPVLHLLLEPSDGSFPTPTRHATSVATAQRTRSGRVRRRVLRAVRPGTDSPDPHQTATIASSRSDNFFVIIIKNDAKSTASRIFVHREIFILWNRFVKRYSFVQDIDRGRQEWDKDVAAEFR